MSIVDPSVSLSGISAQANEALFSSSQASLSTGGGSGGSFSSIAQFQAQYPQIAAAFLQSFAYSMCSQMQDQNDQVVAAIRQAEEDNSP
jgi:hypothetical protein